MSFLWLQNSIDQAVSWNKCSLDSFLESGFLGYIYTGPDMFRSVWDRIHYDKDLLCLHGTGSKLERYGSIWDHLYKWTHLVSDSRSDPYWIHQVSCEHMAYLYQFCIGSKRISLASMQTPCACASPLHSPPDAALNANPAV